MRVPKRKSLFVVEERAVEGARFVTIGPDDPVWTEGRDAPELVGAFVRVRPPAGVEDARLATVMAAVRAVAFRVTGGVKPRGSVVMVSSDRSDESRSRSAREVVTQLVAEARTSDRDALAALTELVMAEAKL